MLVKELIEKLNKMHQDAEVVTPSDVWIDLYVDFNVVEEEIVNDERVVILR